MSREKRENFWRVLNALHDDSEKSINRLNEAIIALLPPTLCRFRAVSEKSLQQLQENKLFFSSADHYDDPFDTYFYINVDQMLPLYKEWQPAIAAGNVEYAEALRQFASLIKQDYDTLANTLAHTHLDFNELKEKLEWVRTSIQRCIYSICFCENPYNETLWLKYADNYKGFVQIYDSADICGTGDNCKNYPMAKERPSIYPMYYSDEKYDATKCALGVWLIGKMSQNHEILPEVCYRFIQKSIMWEFERISLIKKRCHEYDQEWRMIRPAVVEQRSYIKMKPCKIIVGLRTPDYERRLIVSAAKIAGIQEIHELYINDADELASRPISEE